jgi:hypothetical protein
VEASGPIERRLLRLGRAGWAFVGIAAALAILGWAVLLPQGRRHDAVIWETASTLVAMDTPTNESG